MRGLVVVLMLALAGQAHAQRAEAQDAFERGRKQMKDGDFEAACKSFETSLKLEQTIGTLYNLGLCHEKIGKIASAWAEFKQVAATDTNKGRAADASKRVAELEPRLTRFKIIITEQVAGLTVEREGLDMTALVGQPVPVDPRKYKFTASAPGYRVATIDAALEKEGATIDVTIPRLEAAEKSTPPPVPITGFPTTLALRPVTMPDGMTEVFTSSAATTSDSMFAREPVVGAFAGARIGIQKFEIGLRVGFTIRSGESFGERPNPWESVTGTLAYAIQRQFAAGLEYTRLHPIGDRGKGSNFRAVLSRRQLLHPKIAFDGTGGFAFLQRESGGGNVSELVLEAAPGLIATVTPRFALAAAAVLDLNAGGNLFDHTIGLAIAPQALFALRPGFDLFARIFVGLVPAVDGGNSSDLRTYTIGVNWRP